LALACSLLVSAALAGSQTPSVSVEDLALGALGSQPIPGLRDERPVLIASQGGVLFHVGASADPEVSVAEVLYVAACDAAGQELFRFLDGAPRSLPGALWAPTGGAYAFVTSRRDPLGAAGIEHSIELRAFASDGSQPFQFPTPLATSSSSEGAQNVFLAGDSAGSRVFLAGPDGQSKRAVRAFDGSSGAELWKTGLPPGASVAGLTADAAGQRLFVLLEFGPSGFNSDALLALDGQTGAALWDVGLSGTFGVASALALGTQPDGGLVFVAEGNFAASSSGVAAFSGLDGTLKWFRSVPGEVVDLARDLVDPALVVLSRPPWPQSGPATLTALRPLTGLPKWSLALGPPASNPGPTVYGLALSTAERRAFAAFPGSAAQEVGLAAVDLDSGGLVWQQQESALSFSSSGVRPLAVAGSGASSRLAWYSAREQPGQGAQYRVSLRDFSGGGELAASTGGFTIGQARALDLSLPEGDPRGFLLLREGDGPRRLAAFDPASGARLWSTALGGTWLDGDPIEPGQRLASAPGGTAVFASVDPLDSFVDRRLVGLDGAGGALLWDVPLTDVLFERDLEYVAAAGQSPRLVVQADGSGAPTGRTRMLAVDPSSGATLWSAQWPTSGFSTHFAGTLAQAPSGQRIAGAAWDAFPGGLTILVRETSGGQLVFARPIDGAAFANPAVLGALALCDLAYAQDGARLYALVMFGATVSLPPRFGLLALDADSGDLLFARLLGEAPGALGRPVGQLAVAAGGGSLIAAVDVPGIGTRLVAASAQDGAPRWQRDRPGALRAARLDASRRSLYLSVAGGQAPLGRLEAIDAATGVLLAQAQGLGAPWALGPLRFDGARVWTLAGDAQLTGDPAGRLAAFDVPAMVSGPAALSLAEPEPLEFLLDRPAASAGHLYLVLGSLSGTAPGLPLPGGLSLPLVPDALTDLWLLGPNSPPFSGGLGLLDALGDGRARLTPPGGLPSALAGLSAAHAFLEFGASFELMFASAATLVPLWP
jgi:outer membrane protein assembly factor BamB